MSTESNLRLRFISVESERGIFYLRTISRLSYWGLPIGGITYLFLVNTIGLSLFTIGVSFLVAWLSNLYFVKVKMYKLYGWPGKSKPGLFEFANEGFLTTLGNDRKLFKYSDISSVEKIGDFVIIWLNKSYPFNTKLIGIPVYSTAFKDVSRAEFMMALNQRISPREELSQALEIEASA